MTAVQCLILRGTMRFERRVSSRCSPTTSFLLCQRPLSTLPPGLPGVSLLPFVASARDSGEEAAKKSRGICTAFTKDVTEGGQVAFGKEWAATTLLGSDHVPSPAEWQRAMLAASAFVVEVPGAFHEQVAGVVEPHFYQLFVLRHLLEETSGL